MVVLDTRRLLQNYTEPMYGIDERPRMTYYPHEVPGLIRFRFRAKQAQLTEHVSICLPSDLSRDSQGIKEHDLLRA